MRRALKNFNEFRYAGSPQSPSLSAARLPLTEALKVALHLPVGVEWRLGPFCLNPNTEFPIVEFGIFFALRMRGHFFLWDGLYFSPLRGKIDSKSKEM